MSTPAVGLPLAPASDPARRAGRWFHVTLALVAIVVPVVAFAPSIIDSAQRRGPLTPLVVGHAVCMAAWLALFLAQSWLVARRRVALHRSLGLLSLPVAAGLVVTGYAATVSMVRRGFDLSGDLSRPPATAVDQAVFQFGALLLFAVLVSLALLLRRHPQAHKRLMTLATLQVLMTAPLAHMVGHFGLPGLLLPAWGPVVALSLMVYDWKTMRRIHPVSIIAGLGIVVVNNLQFAVIGPSRTWQRLLAWLTA